MRITERRSENPSDLMGVIHQIRRRWRYKLMLRGAVGVLGLGAAALVFSAWGLESWRFSPASIITFRVLIALAFASLVGWFIVRPLFWRVSDEQVALYLEEHEPSLQAEIISAIEASRLAASDNSPHSQVLVRRLVESAVAKCEAIDWGRNVERQPLRRHATTFAVIARRRDCALHARSALPPPRAVGDLRDVAQRRGRRAVPDRGQSRQRERAARRRPDDHRDPRRVRRRPGVAHDPQDARGPVRARAARPQRESERSQQVRRHAVRSGRTDRVFRRGRRGEVGDLHLEGRRSAIRAAARARAAFPGLHGARAAQDRGRRRSGRPQGNGSAGQGHADHDGARAGRFCSRTS